MLQLTPEQTEALERVEHGLLLQRAQAHFALQWPAMAERLGDRLPAFVEFTVQAAERHGLGIALAALRYANLCFVWGSGFEDKPGFAWAQALLQDPRAHAWQKVHQLVRRSCERLGAGTQELPTGDALAQADLRLTQVFAGLGLLGRLLLREGVALPLKPCDLDLAALRVTGAGPARIYQLTPAGAQHATAPALPPPLRIDTAQPAWPARIHVLAPPADDARKPARLQLRTVAHASCDAGWHPHVQFAGAHGAWEWRGGDARAVSWPLAPAMPDTAPGMGAAIAQATAPAITSLRLSTCALREQGLPLGSGAVQVWTYPATQWLLQTDHGAPGTGTARAQLERDGAPVDAPGWAQGLQALDSAVQQGLERLAAVWERTAGLDKPQLSGPLALLAGRAALAWGWAWGGGAAGADLTAPASLQVQAALDLQAISADLHLRGELRMAGVHALLHLRVQGEAALRGHIGQQAAAVPDDAAVCRFRLPFVLELQTIAAPEVAVAHLRGPCTGALVGEAGLRPRLSGGSGWEWYALLRTEAVGVELELHDPWLGGTRMPLHLLPATTLVQWSLG